MCGLSVKELPRVCELCDIKENDDENIKSKMCRALVKLISRFCDRVELLQREDEDLAELLKLNNVLELDSLIEVRSLAPGALAATYSASMDKTAMLERQTTSAETLEQQAAHRTVLDSKTQHRG